MKTKIVVIIITFCVLVAGPATYWCMFSIETCHQPTFFYIYPNVIKPLFQVSIFGWVASLISLFMPERIFRAWLRLAIYFVLIAIVVIAATPVTFTGIFPPPIDFWRNDMARLMGQIFAIITAVFFAWKVIAIKRAGKKDAVPYRAQP